VFVIKVFILKKYFGGADPAYLSRDFIKALADYTVLLAKGKI
jgi:hypothetical protein